MSVEIDLRADCAKCAALCCMAPAFDKSPSFAVDKPALAPCPNLGERGACNIHDKLAECGFSGCVAYDCLGAGQRVVQDVFAGRSWLDEPDLKTPMASAFMVMRRLHDLHGLLAAAAALPLDDAERQGLNDLRNLLEPSDGWSEEALLRAPIEDMVDSVSRFLRSLERHVSTRPGVTP